MIYAYEDSDKVQVITFIVIYNYNPTIYSH